MASASTTCGRPPASCSVAPRVHSRRQPRCAAAWQVPSQLAFLQRLAPAPKIREATSLGPLEVSTMGARTFFILTPKLLHCSRAQLWSCKQRNAWGPTSTDCDGIVECALLLATTITYALQKTAKLLQLAVHGGHSRASTSFISAKLSFRCPTVCRPRDLGMGQPFSVGIRRVHGPGAAAGK